MGEYLSPWELAAYQNRTDQATTSYGNSLASNEYRRSMLGVNFQRSTDNLTRQYDAQRSQLPGSFVGRGLFNSGIYQQGLTNYANDRQRGFDNLGFDYTQGLGQLDIEKSQSTNTYNTGLAGIAAEQSARRAELATQLRSMQ